MLPSSKSDSKHEARFVARIDVLGERVDTLAATVATTASAMAKKDGEIASLHRELQLRDEQIQALAARPQAPAAGDPRELQQLREAVAALSSERSTQGGSKLIDELTAKVGLLGQRLETLSTTVSTTAAGLAGRDGELATIRKRLETHHGTPIGATPTPDPGIKRQLDELASTATGTKLRLDGQAAELESLKSQLAERQGPPADELRAMLTMLRTRVESLDGLRAGVTQEALDDRLMDTDEALARLSQRVEELATGVESATASLSDKEHELAALNRHFMESSSRIETIVDDLREALGAFTDTDPDALAALTRRLDTTSAGATALATRVDRLPVQPQARALRRHGAHRRRRASRPNSQVPRGDEGRARARRKRSRRGCGPSRRWIQRVGARPLAHDFGKGDPAAQSASRLERRLLRSAPHGSRRRGFLW